MDRRPRLDRLQDLDGGEPPAIDGRRVLGKPREFRELADPDGALRLLLEVLEGGAR
jgi:hypothetical protein